MNFSVARAALAASLVFAVPLIGAPAMADDKDTEEVQSEAAPAASEADSEAAPAASEADSAASEEAQEDSTPAAAPAPAPQATAEPEEEKRICRRIRADMSSRRATRVCLTREQWREYNNPR